MADDKVTAALEEIGYLRAVASALQAGWRPRRKREQDGTVMVGWLRLAVAVGFERRKQLEATDG